MTEEQKKARKDRRNTAGGVMIPAGLFIGMGIGWAMDHMIQGMFIGLGVGFLLFGAIMLFMRD